MVSYLDTIVSEKRKFIETLPEIKIAKRSVQRPFAEKLKNGEQMAIIAEFKRASPSKGIINQDADPAQLAIRYEQLGASAVSVLTDQHFKGSYTDLTAVRQAVSLPVLCKDFILEEKQIAHAASAGADLILLIAAILDPNKLKRLHEYAQILGLEPLVEIHDEAELEIALSAGAKLVGINNRNLSTFEVRLETTETLGPAVRSAGAFLISESGIRTGSDAKRAAAAGANGLLVGEALMSAANLDEIFRSLKISPVAPGGTI